MSFIDKIFKAKEVYKDPEDVTMFSDLEKKHKINSLIVDLSTHPALKMLLDDLNTKVSQIDKNLISDRGMSEIDRRVNFAKKDTFLWVISFFDNAKDSVKEIEGMIDTLSLDK